MHTGYSDSIEMRADAVGVAVRGVVIPSGIDS